MHFRKFLPAALALASLAAHSQFVSAEPELRVSGFGTLGYVTTDTDEAQFRSSLRQHKGATEAEGDWGVDSRLGLQGNLSFNDTFSAVGQIYSSRRDGDASPVLEWLFLQANVADWLTLRGGRLVAPIFLLSDSRHVGYAQHWLRAPVEVYGAVLTTSFDGVQAAFHNDIGDWAITTQLSAGEASESMIYGKSAGFLVESKEQSDRMYSLNVLAESGDWMARAGYTHKSDSLVSGMGQTLASGDDDFYSVGLQYDNGSVLAISEHIWRRYSASDFMDGAFDSKGFYLSAGYRFGDLMPYASYAEFNPQGIGYPTSGERRTTALGLRWDAVRNIAIKAQVENISGGVGDQFIPEPVFELNQPTVNAFSIAVDFVF